MRATEDKVKEYEQQYLDGLITQGEKYNKVVDAWAQCTDQVAEAMMQSISDAAPGQPINSVYMMAHSGARGSAAQMKQLAGMRGLMAKPSGEIIETPIISNFKEGLTVLEYFNSTHGARKGLADTALKTANSGYLTRRLVDVAQDSIILEQDCGTQDGITVRPVVEGGEVVSPLGERILGRSAAEDITDPVSGRIIVRAGELIDEEKVMAIEIADIEQVKIRSVLTCDTNTGVCAACYGRDLARGTRVNIGEAVGVIAAQSIGEPGTQLTMRTFHIGGAVQRGAEQSKVEAASDGTVMLRNCFTVRNSSGVPVVMNRNAELLLVDAQGRERARHRLPYGSKLLREDKAQVKRGDKLAEWDPYTLPIITEKEGVRALRRPGRRHLDDRADGRGHRHRLEGGHRLEAAAARRRSQAAHHAARRGRRGDPAGERGRGALLPLRRRHLVGGERAEGARRRPARPHSARIARRPATSPAVCRGSRSCSKRASRRITRSSPRSPAASNSARTTSRNGGSSWFPNEGSGEEPREYLIPKGKHISVQEGDYVESGDPLMDGNPVPHDILRVLGVEALASYLINEIQEVYRLQGVKINDKHIEVIVRQMLQKVEITDPGDTTFLVGEQVDRLEFDEANDRALRDGRKAGAGAAGSAGHHQGQPADPVVHLRGVVPGDHAGADRGGRVRQDRQSVRPEGERHRRPADPGGDGQRHEPLAADRRGSRQGGGGGSKRRGPRRPTAAAWSAAGAAPRRKCAKRTRRSVK